MNWFKNKLLCRCRPTSSECQLAGEFCERLGRNDEFTKDEIKSICSWFHLNNYDEIERLTPYHFKNRWESVLVEGLTSKWVAVLFRDSPDDMSDQLWERLHMILINQWKAKAYERAVITMTIMDAEQNTVKSNQIIEYVDDILNSLLLILVFSENVEFKKWSAGNTSLDSCNRFSSLRRYILKDLTYRESMEVEELEDWLESVSVFKDILGEVCSLCVNLKPPARQLIPMPLCIAGWTPFVNLGHIIFLSSQLEEDDTVEWRLLYNKDIHGGHLEKFEKNTREKGPTLLIIKDENERIFGAYVSHPWTTGEHFYGDSRCFLFTLSPEMNVFRPTGMNSNFQYFYEGQDPKKRGVGLGGNIGNFTIWLKDGLNRGRCSRECRTFNKYEMPTLLPSFRLIQLEVWATRDRCECKQAQAHCQGNRLQINDCTLTVTYISQEQNGRLSDKSY